MKVNCAALPTELLESELFGFERGAFTGAIQHKPGKFEFANHGTMFLDEIGDMSLPLQAKLLQVLQDGEFSRLGGKHDVHVDVRVIAATNQRSRARRRRRHSFARTSSSASTSSRFTCRRCASGARRFRCSATTSSRSTRCNTTSRTPNCLADTMQLFMELRLAGQHPRAREPHQARGGARHRSADP